MQPSHWISWSRLTTCKDLDWLIIFRLKLGTYCMVSTTIIRMIIGERRMCMQPPLNLDYFDNMAIMSLKVHFINSLALSCTCMIWILESLLLFSSFFPPKKYRRIDKAQINFLTCYLPRI